MTNFEVDNILINFGFGNKEDKIKILKSNPDKNVFMDLTCYDQEEFFKNHPNLKGSFSALFCGEDKKIEVYLKEKNEIFLRELKNLGFTPFETTILSIGFIFPRTISQIINEAYFALEEKVASKEDINRAMKFGVNYPKGPFEWAAGKEKYVVTLLDELFNKTQDKRYICNSLLRKEY